MAKSTQTWLEDGVPGETLATGGAAKATGRLTRGLARSTLGKDLRGQNSICLLPEGRLFAKFAASFG